MSQSRPDSALWQEQLERLARQSAGDRIPVWRIGSRRPVAALRDHLQVQETLLRAAYQYFAQASDVQLAVSYAAEWLLDNFYVVEQALRQIREHMPTSYYRQLPKLTESPLRGYPRVYALAREIIGYFESQLDLDRVTRSLQAYQTVTPLTMGELWALPTMLRLGILENLTRALASITHLRVSRSTDSFDAADRSLSESLEDEAIVASCIQSLRMLATQDWKTFFESVSLVEQVLRRDPARVYGRMDFDTRNRYRRVVEELASDTEWDAEAVAEEAIRLAEEAQTFRASHVGYYLLDKGRDQLEASLGYGLPWHERLSRWLLGHPTLVYLGGISVSMVLVLSGLVLYAHAKGGTLAQLIGVSLVALLSTSSMAVSVMNWLVTRTVPPRLLPRLDFSEGIPAECRTMVVIPALLTDAEEVESLIHQLEVHYLGNTDPHLHFALLTDFGDAEQKYMPGDEALLDQAERGVQVLNKEYGQQGVGPFYLFHREREWNPGEELWMGHERKRGKLVAFNRLVRGEESSFTVQIGALEVIPEIRYVITLDADTLMPREGARKLIATLAHPLNRAEFAPGTNDVVAGYTVLQPRVEIKPTSGDLSLFTRIFSGDTGLDLYTRAVSDVYQDLFCEGIFAGKGIYEVSTFERSLEGRVPDNALLSHDLFEGIQGRAGLVTDAVLYEDYPSHYLAHTRRLHRWVRGDWQLLPWLFPKVPHAGGGRIANKLSLIDRWKILDNLRRSLLAPALFTLMVAGWLWLPGEVWVWTLAGVMVLALLVFTSMFTVLRETLRGEPLMGAVQSVWTVTLRWLLALVFLPYETLIMVDAIATTLYRMTISRKRMLQWTTAAHTLRLFGRTMKVGVMWQQMGSATIVAGILTALVLLLHLPSFVVAAPLLVVWMLSPLVAYWISRPIPRKQEELAEDQCRELRRLARRTWLYFEQFIGPDDQWLPPDHFQEDPLGIVAHRTSPTNMGLLLLSTLAAYDLGYLGSLDLMLRLRPTFETMSRMEQYQGHFMNWYDTHSLRPLPPRYISTVDSGNLAACLQTLRQGCLGMRQTPVLRWERWQGLLDTLDVLAEIVKRLGKAAGAKDAAAQLLRHLVDIRQQVLAAGDAPEAWAPLVIQLGDTGWKELERLLLALVGTGSRILSADTLRDLRIWSERVSAQLLSMQGELDMLLPWLLAVDEPPGLFARADDVSPSLADMWRSLAAELTSTPRLCEVPDICGAGRTLLGQMGELLDVEAESAGETAPELAQQMREAYDWCMRLSDELYSARMAAESLLIGLQDLATQSENYCGAMGFEFLFDSYRQVFHIGHNVETGVLDGNYYDLLASEARIASVLAIAKGDVPQSHWLHLSRPVTRVDGTRALLSWGGTMFEYLMPSLLLRGYEGSLLEETVRAAVDHQIAYGHRRGVPWGISESSYYRFDAGRHYQYRGFGVPGLGFRRGLSEDLVIAPYASLIALPVRPQAVLQNIKALTGEQMLGRYGFYEAIDYTRSRIPQGDKSAIVRSYMVHHQGMALLAMTNYLHDNVMVRRTHADPRVQSVQLLLQEQVPRRVPVEFPHPEDARVVRRVEPLVPISPWRVPVDALFPQVHVLSNGRYSVLATGSGSGYSSWRGIDLTRWRADTTLDHWGTWIYVQDQDSGALWSAGSQPTGLMSESYEPLFCIHKVEYGRRDHDISLRTEITVPPEDDVEIRRITLTNHGDDPRHLALTSYGEVVLAAQSADRRHQAFNKLFVESEYLPEVNGLLFRRRLRSADEEPACMIHLLVPGERHEATGAHEADRARFVGRGGTPDAPAALSFAAGDVEVETGRGLSGTTGATLDPVMALGHDVDLEPHATTQIAYVTLAAPSREEAMELALRYRSWPRIGRAFDLAHANGELEMHRLGLATEDVERIEQLLSVLLYPYSALRADRGTLAANTKGQSSLWPHAISGDYPILLVRLGDQEHMDLLRELLQAHAYWRGRQILIDLVILNQKEGGYDQELQGQIQRLIARVGSDGWVNQRGGVFMLRVDQMTKADRLLVETAARAILDGEAGPLSEQLGRLYEQPTRLPRFVPTVLGSEQPEPTPPLERPDGLLFDNGIGGFSPDGREYVIYLTPGQSTPAPWVNVVANLDFGFMVSEMGSGYTWAVNSGENRLTSWANDPVADVPAEVLYLRDEETARVWSPTPAPAGAPAPYLVRHGAGYSIFEHHSHGLKQQLRLFATWDAPVKVIQLRLENTWDRMRRITATFYAEWVLGTTRDMTQQHIVPEFDAVNKVLLLRNAYNEEFGERVAFVAASKELHGLTADRAEFLGREGRLARPAALDRIGLAGTVQPGLDPCTALQIHLDMEPGETQEVFFLLGQAADQKEALRLAKHYRKPARVAAAWEETLARWDELLGTVSVKTPDLAMDLLLNRWLLYQALSCRVWGRSALYQSSGAFGFRDQLQDVMALMCAAPEIARSHILEAARHQFEAGDVLHWWHPPSGRGVRTRCSDDLLWLPFVTAHYVAATGDDTVLNESVPFLTGEGLEPGEVERYGHYVVSEKPDTLYEHCCRALERGMTVGVHGLPLIGSHDWNDGLSRVGVEGKGESVWLGWFLYDTLTRFMPICESMGGSERVKEYRQRLEVLGQALEEHGWDWGWYRRAYYDDGTPLGSSENEEARIDSIAQSWAVLSGAAGQKRAMTAMEAVERMLVRRDDQLILLFAPPFDKTTRDPGYIKAYPPGVRENGGQYTHAATWVVWAFAELGEGDHAVELFRLLNPIYHADEVEKAARYRVEPYVVAADVYSVAPHVGRGGWTWYTGSAGWMYRLGVEAILGLRKVGGNLRIDPCIPKDWQAYEMTYHHGKTIYHIQIESPDHVNHGVKMIVLDGKALTGEEVPLVDDGQQHEVQVLMVERRYL
jgi:cyclic beta-1,2-glucan synthetase